ncbi:MAG: iron-sulfur cluster assembly accessory protein [Calditrichaeota bacterium]|nr:MAG: iron-sulfur cluster assembly accessory protein [Calditrichota bacterium]
MIEISPKAVKQIKTVMTDESISSDYFLRVGVKGGGCSGLSYYLDFDSEERAGDKIFEEDGVRVVVDGKSFLYLNGTELDFSDGLNGKGFQFINPNASRTCGCGESFGV